MGDTAQAKAFDLLKQVRSCSIHAETDIVGRSLRAQMKYADKIGAKYSLVLGDNEIAENKAELKNMETGEKVKVNLDDRFADEFIAVYCDENTTISF